MYPTIFGFIDSYSLMLALGLVSSFVLLEIYGRVHKWEKLLLSAIEILGIVSIIIGFFGAVLMQNLYNFINNPSSYSWSWAMTFYGGLLFGISAFLLGYFLFLRKKYGPFMGDLLIIAPASISVAHAYGRVGCFLAGCCYGKETDSFLGLVFLTTNGVKVLPTQLWEAIFLFLLSAILFLLALKRQWRFNSVIYLCGYGIWRFIIEFFRGDYRGSFIPGLTPSQFWSILLFLGGIIYLLYLLIFDKSKNKNVEQSSSAKQNIEEDEGETPLSNI